MITGDLFADCVALSMCQQADRTVLDELMKEVIALHGEYVARISHTEKDLNANFIVSSNKSLPIRLTTLMPAS